LKERMKKKDRLNRIDDGAFFFCRPFFFQKLQQSRGVSLIKPTGIFEVSDDR
jgi:hypothetical protein